MNSLGNVNHAIRVLGSWILYFNDEVALVLNIKSLDIICAPYVGEEYVAKFETVFYAVG